MKRIVTSLFALILAIGSYSVLAVLAQEETTTNETPTLMQAQEERKLQLQEKYQERVERLTAARETRILERCNTIQERIDNITNRVSTVSSSRGNLIDNIIAKLERFSTRLKESGVDTAALDEDITTLTAYSDELDELWATYADAVTSLKETQCTQDGDSFHEALEIAKLAFADVRAKYKEIKSFIVTDIKADLQAIREQIEKNDDESTEDNSQQETNEQETNPSTDASVGN